MRIRSFFTVAIVSALVLTMAGGAVAQRGKKPAKKYPQETGLMGIRIMDSQLTLLKKLGTPELLEPVQIVGQDTSGGAGGPNPYSSGEGAMPSAAGKGGGPVSINPGTMGGGKGSGGIMPGPGGGGPGGPSMGMPSPGGGSSGGSEGSISTKFTRWQYKRGLTNIAFIVDDGGLVEQIDAVGDSGPVQTKAGIRLGSTFADVIRAYHEPDIYTFRGGIMELKYLNRSHVVFQLRSRGGVQRVMYISVAAGK